MEHPPTPFTRGMFTCESLNVNNWTQDVVDALDEGNIEQFRKLLTSFLADIPYSMRRKETEQ